MSDSKAHQIGEQVTGIKEGAEVTRPNGDQLTIGPGGVYVLDTPGTHTIDGKAYEVK